MYGFRRNDVGGEIFMLLHVIHDCSVHGDDRQFQMDSPERIDQRSRRAHGGHSEMNPVRQHPVQFHSTVGRELLAVHQQRVVHA